MAARLAGGTLAAKPEKPAGGKPVFAVWDEEIKANCGIVVAMDGSVLLFTEEREPRGIVEVKRTPLVQSSRLNLAAAIAP